jgi:ABC-type multidrug transport system permease subunit
MLESTKNAGARMGYSVETEIDSYLNLFSGYIKGGFDVAAAQKLTVDSLSDKSSVNMVSEVKDDNTKIFTIFALLPYAIMTMLLSAVLHVLLRFGSSILRKRSGVSSMPVTNRMIMLALAAGIVTIAGIAILIGIASGLSGEAFTARWVFVVMDVVVFSLTIVMIVVALSNMNIDPDATNALTNVISLSFSFLGGIFVPLEYLGGAAKAIGQFLPTYWYSECLTRIKEGKDFKEILNCLLIQILFGVMVMGVGLVVGKYRDRKTAK